MPNFVVTNQEAASRLDKALAERFTAHSRTFWQDQIAAGHVTVNDHAAAARYLVKAGDKVDYPDVDLTPQSWQPTSEAGITPPLDIIYEDQTVLVINKPAGLVTHPTHAHTDDSVVHRIIAHDQSIQKAVYDPASLISQMRPGIVHRLDKDTSGVLIIAKTIGAMSFLATQIQAHKMTKQYQALLYGHLEQPDITVHTGLNRSTADRRKMAVYPVGEGREASTILTIDQLLETTKGDPATLVVAQPITGRTHQIRVHAAHLGHPVLGDATYGSHESQQLSERLGLNRQFLHALSLSIRLPGQTTPTTFTAPLPPDLDRILKQFHQS